MRKFAQPAEGVVDAVQAREAVIRKVTEGMTCSVTLGLADMIGVGMSLRALAAVGHPNPSTAEAFARVGEQMVAAARQFEVPA